MKKVIVIMAIIVLLIGIVIYAYTRQRGSSSGSAASERGLTSVPVEVALVTKSDIAKTVAATGAINARAEVEVYPKQTGELVELLIDKGDRVKDGQTLAKIESTVFEIQVKQAEADLAGAKAAYEKNLSLAFVSSEANFKQAKGSFDRLQSALKQAELDLQLQEKQADAQNKKAEADLRIAQARLDAAVSGARAQEIEQARVRMENAKSNLDRLKALSEKKLVSKDQVEAAQLQYDIYKAQFSLLEEGTRPEDKEVLKAQLEAAKTSLESAKNDMALIDIKRASLEAAKAQANGGQAAFEEATVAKDAATWEKDLAVSEASVQRAKAALETARFLHVGPAAEESRDEGSFSRFKRNVARRFDALNDKYRDSLDWTLRHRRWVMIVCPSILLLALILIPTLGRELMPAVDEGNVSINIQLPVGTKFQITDELTKERIEKVVRESVPEIKTMRTSVGGGGWFGSSRSHTASVDVDLVDKKERDRSTNEVIADLRRRLFGIPDARIFITSRGSMMTRMLGGREEQVEVDVRGHDLEMGAILAEQVKQLVESVQGTTNVRVSREEGKPELTVLVDRDKSSSLGLNLSTVADTLSTGLTGTVATRYREAGDEYDVRVRFKEQDRLSLDNVKVFFLKAEADSTISLGNIAQIQERVGPINIQRRDQERIITVSASTSGRDFGSIASEINEKLASLNVPEGFVIRFAGEQEEQQKAYRSLIFTLMLAIALVYMVMAAQFESLLHPFVIMFSIPFATIGVVLILLPTGTNLSVPVFIGIIMLAGIVVNNAIVLVDYINLMRRQGMDLREAILEGGRRRLRPILMTTLTTVFALVPMSLGFGAGAEMQAPMARTVLGGLTVATLFTLFFIPTLYSLFESVKGKLRKVSG